MNADTAHLLWTGGWDSTFRLLDLLLVQQRPVQTYYLISASAERPAFGREIWTMTRIKQKLRAGNPAMHDLLRPTLYRDVKDLRRSPDVLEKLQRLRTAGHLGRQYAFLAEFAEQEGVDGLELCIHRDDRAHAFIAPLVTRVEHAGDRYYRLLDPPANPNADIFRHFRFPVFDLSKLEMERIARERGWTPFMEAT